MVLLSMVTLNIPKLRLLHSTSELHFKSLVNTLLFPPFLLDGPPSGIRSESVGLILKSLPAKSFGMSLTILPKAYTAMSRITGLAMVVVVKEAMLEYEGQNADG